ncbi:CTD nuclear envelope phosphatase 1B [Tritrichomonas foetus]|uniref:Mitochondrial import inner membrane translocase subunit TIM50 n=1 Tax=Tritrichomonas foetus TaxID=1144522 RepID=A0A1J4J971_9EUKA|nr:CTD nuclear envelope phosphatase 1B [Tritrichomonas foetus]|eukprot:OHS93965.1 CTD nuclear envelope phosphatase 1B [Tritrichomonas foetus]
MLNSNNSKQMRKSSSLFIIHKPAIALDLDDTLVHVTPVRPTSGDYFQIRFKRRRLFVQTRPNLQNFLKRITKLYDVFVFTSAQREYANLIIDKILPDVKECRRFFRDSCQNLSGYSVKDLSILRRPLKQILLVDDIMGSALKNPKNLVLVKPWYGEKDDDVLSNELIKVLEQIAFESDIGEAYIDTVKYGGFEGISAFH